MKFAIPSRSGPYFTRGKRYLVIGTEGNLYLVKCDKGYVRAISKQSGATCAHLPALNPIDSCGSFDIVDVNLRPMDGPPTRVICIHCRQMTGSDSVSADLDGRQFIDYYCQHCIDSLPK